ncbi:DUF4398 domain-containing protein [Azospirillum halopraeferens]|uniref:DUF4398 domain-containing protein n=1 Tax=Azospirillum halopraeferens TaxID=34010 RepID=UPI0004115443|nr:DUF4398 domain-containing protein [Azospirillum halopraeferens]
MTRCRTMSGGRALTAAALLSLGLAACAGGPPPPTAEMGAAAQAIDTAERAGALQHAPIELQNARDKLAAADAAMQDDHRTTARRLAEQARADAELAAVRAEQAAASEAAVAVSRETQALSGWSAAPAPANPIGGGSTWR